MRSRLPLVSVTVALLGSVACTYVWDLPPEGEGGGGQGVGGAPIGGGGASEGGGGGEGGMPPLDPAAAQPLSVGFAHTCATPDGFSLYCWGSNEFGQLGSSDPDDFLVEVPTPWNGQDLKVITKIVTGARHSCVLVETGDVYCWGDNTSGQLGLGDGMEATTPTLVNLSAGTQIPLIDANDLAAGEAHTCASTGTEVYCWGANDKGQCGVEPAGPAVFVPRLVQLTDGDTHGMAVATGLHHTCVRYSFGGPAVACFGANDQHQLGKPSLADGQSVKPIPTDYTWKECPTIVAGLGNHTCCVDDGHLVCWGDNAQSQCSGAVGDDAPPTQLADVYDGIAAPILPLVGASSTCVSGVLVDSEEKSVRCWGANQNELLLVADPPQNPIVDPATIDVLADAEFVSFRTHACSLSRGTVRCWGDNAGGQIVAGGSPAWIDRDDAVVILPISESP